MVRDDDRMIEAAVPEFGSGVVGICDVCGTRQAVVVLSKERFKLCVLDFLNKTWIGSGKAPGVPAPLYRSERVFFETGAVPSGRAPAIVLSPTKLVRHPVVLITPDVYGITTTVLDGAIRFAREGFEVLIPAVGKTEGLGPARHLLLRTGTLVRGGLPSSSRAVQGLLELYRDAFRALLGRDLVDPSRAGAFGASYGASLAWVLAAEETRLGALALAYPRPVKPVDLGRLVTTATLCVVGERDRGSARALSQLTRSLAGGPTPLSVFQVPGAGHDFLSRDLRSYQLEGAEAAWGRILAFLKQQLMPPPPRPPAPPVRTSAPSPPKAAEAPKPSSATMPAASGASSPASA